MLVLLVEPDEQSWLILKRTYYDRNMLLPLCIQCLHMPYIVMINITLYFVKGLAKHCLTQTCVGLLNTSFEKSGRQQPFCRRKTKLLKNQSGFPGIKLNIYNKW